MREQLANPSKPIIKAMISFKDDEPKAHSARSIVWVRSPLDGFTVNLHEPSNTMVFLPSCNSDDDFFETLAKHFAEKRPIPVTGQGVPWQNEPLMILDLQAPLKSERERLGVSR